MEFAAVIVLFAVFFILLAVGLPVSFSIGLSSFFALLIHHDPYVATGVLAQKMMTAFDNFSLLAIPFFILAGNLMNQAGIAKRLINLAKVVSGPLPGALAHCNIVANMIFGAISGSAVSSAAAVGGIMSPIQKKENYNPEFSAAVNIASCPSGLVIPPSNSLIIYSLASGGTSIAALFVAGYLPGLLMGFGLMGFVGVYALKKSLPVWEGVKSREFVKVLFESIPSLMIIFLVIGGIIAGVVTPTEASALAVVYSLVLGLIYKEIKLSHIHDILLKSISTMGMVLFMVGASIAMSWVMASADIPQLMAKGLTSISSNPIIILLVLNLYLLVFGTFLDITPAILIFTPIFLPVAQELGMNPVHFGIMLVFNLCIGICTPPVGSALFVGCGVAKVQLAKVVKPLLPMYFVLFLGLLVVTYFPSVSLWLPRLLGLM